MSSIVVNGLTKVYKDGTRALHDISFEVERGEVFGVLGPNGAGKTTLVKCLIGLLRPTAGHIRLFGIDPLSAPLSVRRRLGVVHQTPSLDHFLSVWENMDIYARLQGVPSRRRGERIRFLLELFGLSDIAGKKVEFLSGGQRRRLQLARALVHEPEVLILDEPTLGLDPMGRQVTYDILLEEAKKGTTILWTSNYVEEIERHCDRVLVINKGTARALDSPQALKSQVLGHRIALKVDQAKECLELLQSVGNFREVYEEDGLINVRVDKADVSLLPLLEILTTNGMRIRSISVSEPSLEEVYLKVIR